MATETTWQKLQPLDGRPNPCVCCPPIPATLGMERTIAVGFGDAHVERDGETVYREPGMYAGTKPCEACEACGGDGRVGKPNVPEGAPMSEFMRAVYALPTCETCKGDGRVRDDDAPEPEWWDVARAEEAAMLDPDHDWRIVLYGPLHGEQYQRHGAGEWMLVEKNEGFA